MALVTNGLIFKNIICALGTIVIYDLIFLDPPSQDQSTLSLLHAPLTGQSTDTFSRDVIACINSSATLKNKVKSLEKVFNVLARKTFRYFESHPVSVRSFKGVVSSMDVSLKASYFDHLKTCFSGFNPEDQIADAWLELSSLWDFLNYEFLKHVLEIFIDACDKLRTDIQQYTDVIAAFCTATKVCDFFEAWPFRLKKPKKAVVKKMVVKAERNWEECTLQDIKETTNTLAQLFSLPRSLLLLRDVEDGCVSILLYIPPSVAASLEQGVTKVKPEKISSHDFISITVDDQQVHPITSVRQCSLELKKMYSLKCTSLHKKFIKKRVVPFKLALVTKYKYKHDKDMYTRRTLHGDVDDVYYKKSPTAIHSLGYLDNGSPARLVLLEGAPGSGKTTFGFDVALKWTNNQILADVHLLALFPLRDYNLRKVSNLRELLSVITPEYESLLEELEATKGMGTAFWLDGWDEIASSLDGHSSIYEQLVSGKLLPKARVFVASRPWATDYIRTQLDEQPSQHIELVSSYQDQIDWLIELNKQELPSKLLTIMDGFLKYLQEAPAIRCNMHTPMATDITLEVYQWSQESSSPLPTTVTQLYTSYTCLCIHKYLDNHSYFNSKLWKSNDFRDLPEPLHSWFLSLCQLAYDGLLDGKRLVFPDVPNNLRLESLGLMQAQAPLYASEESAVYVVSYHYNHLTLQEFLSAQLLSWMSDEERSVIVEKYVDDGYFTMVLRFLSGLTKSSPMLKNLSTKLLLSYDRKLFHWLFERGDKALIADILRETKYVQSHLSWTALDYFVTGYCIARSNSTWGIDFNSNGMGDEKMTQFLQALNCKDGEQGNASLTSLSWRANELTSQSLRHFQDIPIHFFHSLKRFNISNNDLDKTAVVYIAKTIPHMPQLVELTLMDNSRIQRGGAVSLVSALCDHNALKYLDLSGTNIGKEDCDQLARLLSSSQCLETLYIGFNSLSSDSIIELVHALSHPNCSLKTLNLSGNPIGDEGAAALAQSITKNKTITWLWLSRCGITATGGAELASSVTVNSTIERLHIGGNSLGEAVPTYAELVRQSRKLKTLDLYDDKSLSQSNVNFLLDSLADNRTLEELVLPRRFEIDMYKDKRVKCV